VYTNVAFLIVEDSEGGEDIGADQRRPVVGEHLAREYFQLRARPVGKEDRANEEIKCRGLATRQKISGL